MFVAHTSLPPLITPKARLPLAPSWVNCPYRPGGRQVVSQFEIREAPGR
jgi:hypothetical protein